MKVRLIVVGKTAFSFLKEGEQEYIKRLKHYCTLEVIEIQDVKNPKNLSHDQLKKAEGEKIIQALGKDDVVYLLDDKGQHFTSLGLSKFIEKQQQISSAPLTCIIGGAFGFSEEIYRLAKGKISLSSLTFSHQMIRMIFLEQLYRAFTIIKGEKYHHE